MEFIDLLQCLPGGVAADLGLSTYFFGMLEIFHRYPPTLIMVIRRYMAAAFGACLAFGGLPAARAATSATITASGTVPGTCEVSPADILMTPDPTGTELGGGSSAVLGNNNGGSFTLSPVQLTAPVPLTNGSYEPVLIIYNGASNLLASTSSAGSNYSSPNPLSVGTSKPVLAQVTMDDGSPLPPGNYSLSATLSCVSN